MNEGKSAEEMGGNRYILLGLAILEGVQGPNMLHIFFLFLVVRPCWGVPQMFFHRRPKTF